MNASGVGRFGAHRQGCRDGGKPLQGIRAQRWSGAHSGAQLDMEKRWLTMVCAVWAFLPGCHSSLPSFSYHLGQSFLPLPHPIHARLGLHHHLIPVTGAQCGHHMAPEGSGWRQCAAVCRELAGSRYRLPLSKAPPAWCGHLWTDGALWRGAHAHAIKGSLKKQQACTCCLQVASTMHCLHLEPEM